MLSFTYQAYNVALKKNLTERDKTEIIILYRLLVRKFEHITCVYI